MRCCASPTTYNVDNFAAQRVATMLEGMLLAPMLRPMVTAAGVAGDYELGLLAQEIARKDSHGFAALIADRLQHAP
jgi:hypothetical protein